MSLFFRRQPEQRAVTSIAGWGRGDDVMGSSTSMSSALSIVPVFAATRLLTDSVSTLPLQAYRKVGDAREPLPLPSVFGRADGKRIQWLQQALMSLLLRGNAYGYVVEFSGGFPGRVVWLNPEDVQVDESGALPVYRWKGREIPRELIKHIPAYSLPGSVCGVSPIGACAMLGDTGAAVQKMMTDWFRGKAIPGSIFKNSEVKIDQEAGQAISDALAARLRNGKPLVHGKDWSFEPVTLSADDAAFISTAQLNATQVATIYGIPPEMIGGQSGAALTYSTVELNSLNFLQYSLDPWIDKLEEEFSSWLQAPRFVKFNTDAMIRTDTKTRHEVYQIDRNIGLKNIDELRALDDLPALPDGQGQDYTPLGKSSPAAPKETR